jgi:hypothetical protein
MDGQSEFETQDFQQEYQGVLDEAAPPPASRAKTSLRLRYEAEGAALQRKIGGLEDMRHMLGLSRRKICQLLLVDPSAWTRWTRPGQSPPPHIFRSLQWFLALQDKYPAVDAQFWLQALSPRVEALRQIENNNVEPELKNLKEGLEQLRQELKAIEGGPPSENFQRLSDLLERLIEHQLTISPQASAGPTSIPTTIPIPIPAPTKYRLVAFCLAGFFAGAVCMALVWRFLPI